MVCATVHLPRGDFITTRKWGGCAKGRFDWLQDSSKDLQDSKLPWSDDEDGGEHQPNADSKHCQGCEQETTKDEQSIPPTHCGYWSAQISVVNADYGMQGSFCAGTPICHIGHRAQPAQSAGEQMTVHVSENCSLTKTCDSGEEHEGKSVWERR